ncbi:tryptophan 7-halogenase, partial [Streptococcus suis]
DMDNIKDFLILHYHATTRDEPLWRHTRAMEIPDTLAARIDHYRRAGRLMVGSDDLFRDASWLAVLDGQGVTARDYNPVADTIDAATNRAQVE